METVLRGQPEADMGVAYLIIYLGESTVLIPPKGVQLDLYKFLFLDLD